MIPLLKFASIPYLISSIRGGVKEEALPVLFGDAYELPNSLDALILTSDLLGREPAHADGSRRLLALALAEQLVLWSTEGNLPAPDRTGIILGGELFADEQLKTRSKTGDISDVWDVFADNYRWVTGILGSHDQLNERERLEKLGNVHILDDSKIELEGLKFAGLCGRAGEAMETRRDDPAMYYNQLRQHAKWRPDFLLMRQGPSVREQKLLGSDDVRRVLDDTQPPMVICGHLQWKSASADLSDRTQVLNVAGRVVVLRRAPRID